MILNFKTRNEARSYCWKWSIPLKQITKGSGSHPWTVRTKEARFENNKQYKLVDVEGFTNDGKNTANRVQAKQINDYLNGIVKITGRNGDTYTFDAPVGVAMFTLRAWEAKYFAEVSPAKAAKPKRAKKPTPVGKPSVAPAPAKPDLDSELDGGVNLAPVAVPVRNEDFPGSWTVNRSYVLVDEDKFINNHGANHKIVEFMKQHTQGVLVLSHVDLDGDAYIKGAPHLPCILHRERKFFRELGTGKAPETPSVQAVDIDAQKRDQQIIEAAQKVEDALKVHQEAIQTVQQAAHKVREAAQELALLSRK